MSMASAEGGAVSHGGDAPSTLPVARDAWAKINLTLEVTGKRPDGYHELDSLIVFAGVGDRLSLEPAERFELIVEGPQGQGLSGDDDNLVMRAAALLLRHAQPGADLPALRLRLEKRLPVASGIGGGSADAAAALVLLADRMTLTARPGTDEIVSALGADVPVCLFARPALVGGLGDEIERAPPLPPAWLVLANPGRPLSTPAVFKAREGPFSPKSPWTEAVISAQDLAERLRERRNDLEAPAKRLMPEIDEVLTALEATESCLLARMSGSGATCFGLFAERAAAETAAAELERAHPNWWLASAPMLHGPLEGSWWDVTPG